MSAPAVDPYLAFVGFYDTWTEGMEGDVAFYVSRALEAGDPMVELAVGNGRIAIPTARAGRTVIGVDASPSMIDDGRRRAREAGVGDRIRWVHADMRDFVQDPPVDLVTIPFRSFLHLTSTPDQLIALANAHESLVPGGRLILNMFVPDPEFMASQNRRRTIHGERIDDAGRRVEIWAIPRYEVTTQQLWLEIGADTVDGERVVDSTTTTLELRLVYRHEMEHLLARTGFEVEAIYGDFDERPLTEECREMIWVARKP